MAQVEGENVEHFTYLGIPVSAKDVEEKMFMAAAAVKAQRPGVEMIGQGGNFQHFLGLKFEHCISFLRKTYWSNNCRRTSENTY